MCMFMSRSFGHTRIDSTLVPSTGSRPRLRYVSHILNSRHPMTIGRFCGIDARSADCGTWAMNTPVAVRSGTFVHRGFELAYEVYGDSGVPCLLVHGLLLDSLLNRDLAQRFVGEGYQVVLLDLLGHGKSEKPTDPREHRVDFYAEQVLACLDHLNIDKALVGGISLGAITGLQFAAIAPQRVLGLFLEMPVMEWSTTFAAVLLTPRLTIVDYGKWPFRPFARLMRPLPRPRIG